MGYINVMPPLSETEIEGVIRAMEADLAHNGCVLSKMVDVCSACGFKKKKLIELTWGDVPGLPSHVQDRLNNEYLAYMKKEGFRITKGSPLFPEPSKGKYSDKNLQNHLKHFFSKQPFKISLEKIRQTAVCRYYNQLKGHKKHPDECLAEAAKFAGCKEKETTGILKRNIQRTGYKNSPAEDYLGKIDRVESRKELESVDGIQEEIAADPRLKAKVKKALIEALNKSVQRVKEELKRGPKEESTPEFTSLTDAIRNSD